MKKSKHMTVGIIVVTLSTALMLFDYALMMPTPTLSLLPGGYSGFFATLGVAHIFDLIRQHRKKD